MHRHASYSYPPAAPTPQRCTASSSAFSASANPNEDWTKISDLAERRRIQNRIAQRNYRKKLKKRLEDLERRAASNSASPEQQPAELDRRSPQLGDDFLSSDVRTGPRGRSNQNRRTPEPSHSRYLSTQDDRGMFSHQYTRQLSASPPPFSYSSYHSEPLAYAPFPQHTSYESIPITTSDMPAFAPYLPPLSSTYSTTLPGIVYPTKQEYYIEEEMSPFSMSYASMAGIDIIAAQSYPDSDIHTPPLSDCFDHSVAGSPPDSTTTYPTTPASMPGTPPLRFS